MLRVSKAELVSAAIVFVVALFVYTWTLAPTVTLVDSGELIVAARFLGVAHPPGFPLYLMLAHLASLVPIGNVAERVNFNSAFFAALACAMLTLVVAEIMITAFCVPESERQSRKARKGKMSSRSAGRAATDNSTWLLAGISAVGAGLLLAFSRTLWSYATIAEVYSLNTFLILTVLFLMLRWRRRIVEDQRHLNGNAKGRGSTRGITRHDLLLYSAAVVFGLALGVHHVTVALTLPALAVLVYRTQGFGFFASRRLLYAAAISFTALIVVYSYLPIAAAHNPILNWGDPRTLPKIWAHITGKQYQLFLSSSPAVMSEEFLRFRQFVLREFGTPWLPLALVLAVAGFVGAWKRDRTTFLWLLFIVLANFAYNLIYEIAEDKDAYYLPIFVSIAVAAGIGAYQFLRTTFAKPRSIAARLLVPASLILILGLALVSNWPFNNRNHDFIAQDYVENIEETIAPHSLLLTRDWQVASPMLYTREIERRRLDINVVDVQLLRRSWYFEYLRHAYPDMIERLHDKVDVYLAQLKQWEKDPETYNNSAVLSEQITSAFDDLTHSLVSRELQVAPVYVTNETFVVRKSRAVDFMRWLNRNFQGVPKGLVFQLFRDRDFHDPGELHLQTRGLTDKTMKFEKDDVVNVKVIPAYKAMLENRGLYLAHFGRQEQAAAAFAEARRFKVP
jgi:Protein O-mannosyl-transferase TMEM260-like